MSIFLAVATISGLIVHQVDIVGAYLESLLGDVDQPIYMRLPPGIDQIQADPLAVEKPLWSERIRKILG